MSRKKTELRAIFAETRHRFPHVNEHAFEVLFHGWRQQQLRHGRGSDKHFTEILNRGWLYDTEAESLREYIGR